MHPMDGHHKHKGNTLPDGVPSAVGLKAAAGKGTLPSILLLCITIAIFVVGLGQGVNGDRHQNEQITSRINVIGYRMELEHVLSYVQHHAIPTASFMPNKDAHHDFWSATEAVCRSSATKDERLCQAMQDGAILNADLCQLGLLTVRDLEYHAFSPPDRMDRPYLGLFGMYRMVKTVADMVDHEFGFNGSRSLAVNVRPPTKMILPYTHPTNETHAEQPLASVLLQRGSAPHTTTTRVYDLSQRAKMAPQTPSMSMFTNLLKEWAHGTLGPNRDYSTKYTPWNNNATLLDQLKATLQWKVRPSSTTTLVDLQDKAQQLIVEVQLAQGPFGWLPIYLVLQLITDHLMLEMASLRTTLEAKAEACLPHGPPPTTKEEEGKEDANDYARAPCYFTSKALAGEWALMHAKGTFLVEWLSQAMSDAVNQTMRLGKVSSTPLPAGSSSPCRIQSGKNDTPMWWEGKSKRHTKTPHQEKVIGWVTVRCLNKTLCWLGEEGAKDDCNALWKEQEDRYDEEFRTQLDVVYHHLVYPYLELLKTFTAMAKEWADRL